MNPSDAFSDEAVAKRSLQAKRELEASVRSAKAKKELDNENMDKKERRPLKEFTTFRTEISEHVGVPAHSMPPNILILRRKTIRQFPNNVMVALYFNDKLGQYFSIPYGGVEADETVITPVALKEANTLIKPEDLFRSLGGLAKDLDKNAGHQVGDMVSYGTPSGNIHKRGKIVKLGDDHVTIHRKEPHGGKYGYHYKVPYDSIVHNERLSTERVNRMGESVELNEISLKTAGAAYEKRMADAHYNNARSTASKDHFWRKEFAKRGSMSAGKGQHILRMMGKKVERNDAKSRAKDTVKEAVIAEDAISHLKKVVAFKTSTPLYHKDGTQTKIDPQTANALLTVHQSLHPDNRQKFADHLEHSKPQFAKMLDFAWKQVK
jgi:hypothetical protein